MKVPGFLRERFERSGGSFNEYVIFRVQIGTILLFVFSLLWFFGFSWIALVGAGFFFLLNFYSVFFQLKNVRNHFAYKYFFGGLNLFGLVLAVANFFLNGFDLNFSLLYLFALGFFLVVFQFKVKKNYVFGEVLASNSDWAAVQIPFDLCSGIKNGFYAVKSMSGVKKGDQVKIAVAHGLGERRRPWRIIK
ncbi:DUF2101 family protein [archaeon]|nr:DUF2101 family protein [archaeon]